MNAHKMTANLDRIPEVSTFESVRATGLEISLRVLWHFAHRKSSLQNRHDIKKETAEGYVCYTRDCWGYHRNLSNFKEYNLQLLKDRVMGNFECSIYFSTFV